MSRRVFYDPSHPVMLTDAEIDRLSPAEAKAACDQIDQNLVRVLLKIDENFAEANQILTSRILPAVQEYGENSQQIWASVKFWKSFFEASANTKLDNPYQMGDVSYASQETDKTTGPADEGDESLKFQEGDSQAETDSASGTPRATQAYSADMSPYQALQKDLKALNSDLDVSPAANKVAIDQSVRDLERLRLGLQPESPAMPSLPDFETGGMSLLDDTKGKGRAADISYGSPMPRQKAGVDKFNADLRQKLLLKQMASPAPFSAQKGRLFPTDVPKGWNGLADLSQTSLASFTSPAKPGPSGVKKGAVDPSPAPSMSYELSHAPSFTATPHKEAARRVAQNVYDDAGSPQPPSVLKNWRETDYTEFLGDAQPSPSEGLRKGFEGESYLDDDEVSMELAKGRVPPLADFQAGTTGNIGDLLKENSFARIVDDNDGVRPGGDVFDEDSLGEGELSIGGNSDLLAPAGGDESYLIDEDISRDLGAEGPEDTLFGMPQKGKGKTARFDTGDTDDSFELERKQKPDGSGFRVMGMDDMVTLHGGELLADGPLEASPLAARDRR